MIFINIIIKSFNIFNYKISSNKSSGCKNKTLINKVSAKNISTVLLFIIIFYNSVG